MVFAEVDKFKGVERVFSGRVDETAGTEGMFCFGGGCWCSFTDGKTRCGCEKRWHGDRLKWRWLLLREKGEGVGS